MKDRLISFETAKLAKEKGFDVPIQTAYRSIRGGSFHIIGERYNNGQAIDYITKLSNYNDNLDEDADETWSRPTQSLLQQWLREEHNIKLAIIFRENASSGIESWDWLIKGQEVAYRQYKTYELALEAGLLEGLKLIK